MDDASAMADLDDDTGGTISNRVWRLERQVHDVLVRFDKFEQKLEKHAAVQERNVWRLDNIDAGIKSLVARVDALDERNRLKPSSSGSISGLTENTIKFVVYGLLAAVVALSGGQVANFLGIFGGK
jgi:hypothetical protein